MKKAPILILGLVLLLSLFSACSGGRSGSTAAPGTEPILIRTSGLVSTHFSIWGVQKWAKDVMEKTNGSINVEIYTDYQLGSDREILEAIQMETFEMNFPAVSVLTNFVREFTIISLPYLFPDAETANAVMEGPFGDKMLEILEPAGFKGLVFTKFGLRHVTNNIRPITRVEDFRGLKLRTMENASHLEVFRALGANPTAMTASEVFTALQQRVIDGQENPISNIFSQGYHEAQRYLSLTGHVYEWVPYILGMHVWNKMTSAQQGIVMEVSRDVRAYMLEAEAPQTQEDAIKIEAAGCAINDIAPAEKERIMLAVQPVVERFGNDISPELFRLLRDETARNRR